MIKIYAYKSNIFLKFLDKIFFVELRVWIKNKNDHRIIKINFPDSSNYFADRIKSSIKVKYF